ncbi:MAG TPA: hypothetical protein VLF41_02730 [Candidatus Nanoarchaeia archaeon]|nr:hypothetical protein [Candidatus Nanoarchaeia archaeon]
MAKHGQDLVNVHVVEITGSGVSIAAHECGDGSTVGLNGALDGLVGSLESSPPGQNSRGGFTTMGIAFES